MRSVHRRVHAMHAPDAPVRKHASGVLAKFRGGSGVHRLLANGAGAGAKGVSIDSIWKTVGKKTNDTRRFRRVCTHITWSGLMHTLGCVRRIHQRVARPSKLERAFTIRRVMQIRGRGSLAISVYQIVPSRVFICSATLARGPRGTFM